MSKTIGLESLFQQRLDRALFVAYFAGAVVPLIALSWLVHRHVLPEIAGRGSATASVIGALVGAGTLVLAGYFAIRRLARRALDRMASDNAVLTQLLATARALPRSGHVEEIVSTTVATARALTNAAGACILSGDEKGEFVLLGGSGWTPVPDEFEELSRAALEQPGHVSLPVEVEGAGSAPDDSFALAVAFPSSPPAVLVVLRSRRAGSFEARERDALEALTSMAGVARDRAEFEHSQRNFFAHTTDLLVTALDGHVGGRAGHSRRVAQLAHCIARELGLEDDSLRRIHFAALLHDVGMLRLTAVHQAIPAQRRQHPAAGARMLRRIRFWQDLAPIVRHHHEHYDGSGYPAGLVADAIPIESRIIAVADAFDVMRREAGVSEPSSLARVTAALRDGMGREFDPQVARALLDLLQRGAVAD